MALIMWITHEKKPNLIERFDLIKSTNFIQLFDSWWSFVGRERVLPSAFKEAAENNIPALFPLCGSQCVVATE